MQAGKSNWVLETSWAYAGRAAKGFPFTTCREGNTGTRRGLDYLAKLVFWALRLA